MEKLKTKIARVSILALSFLLVFFITVYFGTKKTKAYGVDLEFVNYEILDHQNISDLPYLPSDTQHSFLITQWIYGYYVYNNKMIFFLVLSPDHNNVRAGEVIVYLSNCDTSNLLDELVDQEYYEYLNSDIGSRLSTAISICIDSGYMDIAPITYYFRLDSLNLVGVGDYQYNNVKLLLPQVDEAPAFYQQFGALNNAYYSDLLFSNTVDYFYQRLEDEPISNIESYQRGVRYGKESQQGIINSQQNLIDQKNQAIADLQDQLLNADTEFASFDNLLAAIFMYPIRFLTEGLDVNIFGINLGDFVLGLFMITIMLSLFRFILGRR